MTIEFPDAAALDELVQPARVAAMRLTAYMVGQLPRDTADSLADLAAVGWRIGIECTADRVGTPLTVLVAIGPDGTRRPIATVLTRSPVAH